jgi:hypothetical protein
VAHEKLSEASEREKEIGLSALGTLVKQFGNKYDFVRELVQNSLDSGTPQVEVWTDFHPGERGAGVMEIHVDDTGVGMDEEIIDHQLTRLFSSSKENDLTNIGKFGIGFVSVFAIDPEGVLVRTARGGERWEIFFNRDRTFEKTVLAEPIEGTRITVFATATPEEYEGARVAVFSMLKFWCKHAEKPIYFWDAAAPAEDDRPDGGTRRRRRRRRARKAAINEPLEVDGFTPIHVERGESEIAMALSHHHFYGFYNRGLTLKESSGLEVLAGYEAFFDKVSFKIKSPYLEHTLTRDTIRKDGNYVKAIALLIEAARRDLIDGLLGLLERLAALPELAGDDLETYLTGLGWLHSLPRELDPTFDLFDRLLDLKSNIVPTLTMGSKAEEFQRSVDASKRKIFRACHGGPLSIGDLKRIWRKSDSCLILSPVESSMTRELHDHDRTVVLSPDDYGACLFFDIHVTGDRDPDEERKTRGLSGRYWFIDRLGARDLTPRQRDLFERVERALLRVEFPARRLRAVNFLGDDPSVAVVAAVLDGEHMATRTEKILDRSVLREVGIDVRGSAWNALADLHERAPRLALAQAVRRICLETLGGGGLSIPVGEAIEEALR